MRDLEYYVFIDEAGVPSAIPPDQLHSRSMARAVTGHYIIYKLMQFSGILEWVINQNTNADKKIPDK